jgi:hypothetical protein
VGHLPWLPPHRADLEVWGQDYGDIAFGSYELLVSERFKDLWTTSNLQGLSGFWPVEIVKVKRRNKQKMRGRPPNYYCVSIGYGRSAIDYRASGITFEKGKGEDICQECNMGTEVTKSGHRLVFTPGTWSGEDIFFPRGRPACRFASTRFNAFCTENAIKNALLLPAETYSYGFKWDRPKN